MKGKIYKIGEIERMDPLLAHISEEIRALFQRLNEILRGKRFDELATGQVKEKDQILARLDDVNDEVERLGGVINSYEEGRLSFYAEDPFQGRCDTPGVHSGVIGKLSWSRDGYKFVAFDSKYGEPAVETNRNASSTRSAS